MLVFIFRALTYKISRVTPLKLVYILKNSRTKNSAHDGFALLRFLYFQYRLKSTPKHNI